MLDFQIPRITSESVEEHRGSFVIEPLDRGFGYTFGNSLRRVLLSSLAGAAVTSVRIEGVSHEFSNVPGVKEDVTDIILNLKSVVVRMHTDASEVEVPLVASGPGEITAGDIDLPAGVEILNPEAPIATLEKKTKLEMYLTVGRGRGYSPAEFYLRMTREEIGSYLGLKLETVSRAFSRFQEEGLIAVQQKHVRILSIPGLKQLMNHQQGRG